MNLNILWEGAVATLTFIGEGEYFRDFLELKIEKIRGLANLHHPVIFITIINFTPSGKFYNPINFINNKYTQVLDILRKMCYIIYNGSIEVNV